MAHDAELDLLATRVASVLRPRHLWRTRWAALGAAVAITAGGGAVWHASAAGTGASTPASFVSIAPVRILDTRPAPENVGGFVGPMTAGSTHTFQVTGIAGVPVTATAVTMNVTVTGTTAASYLTVFPAGADVPTASNLNWAAGDTVPNLVTVAIGTGGQVSLYDLTGDVQVIADVAGYFVPANDHFLTLPPGGVESTRPYNPGPGGGVPFDGSVNQEVTWNMVLPPDYTPGSAITATFTWQTVSTSCVVSWRPSFTSVTRAGQAVLLPANAAAGMSGPTNAATLTTARDVHASTITLTSPVAGFTLQPGDSYTFGIFRLATAASDTCLADALIDSMTVRYG